uniref:ATP synthase F0 subunit 8 n=1 Tax=Dicerca corrugata TaxID=1857262 RepID=UPI002008ED0E|nr:ATP synthase F0 subunit 8 [Dicerca corrugata]UPI13487.1 ATP synthase F0 subunit 8 [Dicerca corrugata]
MPQMSPMNWLPLFILFSIIFILFIILNFFNTVYPNPLLKSEKSKININWKW